MVSAYEHCMENVVIKGVVVKGIPAEVCIRTSIFPLSLIPGTSAFS